MYTHTPFEDQKGELNGKTDRTRRRRKEYVVSSKKRKRERNGHRTPRSLHRGHGKRSSQYYYYCYCY
jgi:hypothetical protein